MGICSHPEATTGPLGAYRAASKGRFRGFCFLLQERTTSTLEIDPVKSDRRGHGGTPARSSPTRLSCKVFQLRESPSSPPPKNGKDRVLEDERSWRISNEGIRRQLSTRDNLTSPKSSNKEKPRRPVRIGIDDDGVLLAGHYVGLDGLSTIVQGALTSTDIGERNPSVAWSAYLVAYAILLIGSVVLWLWAIALTIRPPGGRNKGESSEKPLDLMP
jgi:hypothetical protein